MNENEGSGRGIGYFGGMESNALNLPLIASYTRAEAIEDGALVDVTTQARETLSGFRVPVAVT